MAILKQSTIQSLNIDGQLSISNGKLKAANIFLGSGNNRITFSDITTPVSQKNILLGSSDGTSLIVSSFANILPGMRVINSNGDFDFSSIGFSPSTRNWFSFPRDVTNSKIFIIQYGVTGSVAVNTSIQVTFPVQFSQVYSVVCSSILNNLGTIQLHPRVNSYTTSTANFSVDLISGSPISSVISYAAIGVV